MNRAARGWLLSGNSRVKIDVFVSSSIFSINPCKPIGVPLFGLSAHRAARAWLLSGHARVKVAGFVGRSIFSTKPYKPIGVPRPKYA